MTVVSRVACCSTPLGCSTLPAVPGSLRCVFSIAAALLFLLFFSPGYSSAQTYTSDQNIADFTNLVSTYATLSNYSNVEGGCGSPSFTPTSAELATTGCRIYNGGAVPGLSDGNNWLLATFPNAVSSIIVFPNIDHYGDVYDGYQYVIYGSNDGQTWTFLFDASSTGNEAEPFTLGQFSGTPPSTVNNVLTPQSQGLDQGCSGTPGVPCAIGYIAQFTFGAAYKYYAFGASTLAFAQGNPDQELSAVGTAQVINGIQSEGTTTVTTDFSNSSGALTQTIIIPPNNNNPNQSDSIVTTNQVIACDPNSTPPYDAWHKFVVGTPWAVSHCAPHSANGANNGTLYVNACWDSKTQSLANASDAFCPTVNPDGTQGSIVLEDTFDWVKESIVNGATASLIAFTPPSDNPYLQWAPSEGTTNQVCPSLSSCTLFDTLYEMFGDQTTTRGTSPRTKSWNVTAIDVPTELTSVYALPNGDKHAQNTAPCPLSASAALNQANPNLPGYEDPTFTVSQNKWFNGNCLVNFVVNQAVVPTSLYIPPTTRVPVSNNNFIAAPVSSLIYGAGTQHTGGEKPLVSNPPSSQFDTSSQLNGLTLGMLLNNTYDAPAQSLFWSSVDIAGIIEKNIQKVPATGNPPTCPVPADVQGGPIAAPVGGECYITSDFTVQVNLDSTAPLVSLTFNPASGPYSVNQQVSATFNCTDLHLLSCTATNDGGAFGSGGNVITTFGNHSVTVTGTDLAGNITTTAFPYSVTAPPADVAIFEGLSIDAVKHGSIYNYPAWTLDLTKGVAATNVYINATVTIPTSSLNGNASGKFAVVSCSLTSGCSAMPSGASCTLTGSMPIGSNTIQTLKCSIGTLQSVYNLQGARVQVSVPVAAGAKIGSTFRIDARVFSDNDPVSGNNSVSDVITVK